MPRDVNDMMREEGPDAVRKALDGALASEALSNDADPAGEDVQRPRRTVTLHDFCAYMVMHKYIFMDTGDIWPASSVDARIPPIPIGGGKEISASKWLDRRRPVEQVTWTPGRPQIISDQVIAEGGWIDRPGCSVFNLYRPPILKHGNANKAGKWLEHIERVYGADAPHIIAWLAHRVQRPGEKVNRQGHSRDRHERRRDSVELIPHCIAPRRARHDSRSTVPAESLHEAKS
jgi:hypothetical protein